MVRLVCGGWPMIRLLIAGSMVLMAGNAKAGLNNEELYKSCKSYADGGFVDNGLCLGFFAGVKDTGQTLCIILNFEGLVGTESESIANFAAIENVHVSVDSVIQNYVNKMREQPEKWSAGAQIDVTSSFQSFIPCKPE